MTPIPCSPPWWLRGGHAQTLAGHLFPSPTPILPTIPVRIPLSDGGQLAADHIPGKGPVVCLFHGLSGDSTADYMVRLAAALIPENYSVYLVNHRGCGTGVGLATGPYHSGRGEDISDVLAFCRKQEPAKPCFVVGFSISGAALLNLLVGHRGTVLPEGAIAVNAPLDLETTSQRLGKLDNRLYDMRFVLRLRSTVREKFARGELSKPVPLPWWKNLREFDERYTAPQAGFRNRQHYYETCSTHLQLHKITVPTVLLTSEDDPIVPVETYRQAKLSSAITRHIERHGGHMGYLTKNPTPLQTKRWLDYAILWYLKVPVVFQA